METTATLDPVSTAADAAPCGACEANVVGRYCSACGERRPQPDDERLWPFLRDQFHEVTSADGRMWRTLRSLFVPGTLTVEYFSGRRTRYLRPIRLFLVLNVVLFFAISFLQKNPLMGEFDTQRGVVGAQGIAAAEAKVAAWGGEMDIFVPLFDQRAGTLSSTLVVLLIPAFAVLFAVAFGSRRGARHLTFATHAVSALVGAYLAVLVAFLVPVLALLALGMSEEVFGVWFNWVFVVALLGAVSWYLARGAERVYGIGAVRAWAGGLALAGFALPVVIVGYRVLLFWLTLWTLDLPPA